MQNINNNNNNNDYNPLILNFQNYEQYLDSFVVRKDLYYLQNLYYARLLPELGLRGETLTKTQFFNEQQRIREILNPSKKPHTLTSEGYHLQDIFLYELSLRERSNRVGLLSTIIFLRHRNRKGYEISGYIDFEDSLRRSIRKDEDSIDWNEIFSGKKRIWPRSNDLGYFHWRSGYSVVNDTDNFKVITDTKKGLLFMSRHDRLLICVDPLMDSPGTNSTRTIINSDKYDHIVLYDHVIRNKI